MMQQQTPQVPAALQALMVLKQQASPVTPQGTPTIAAQTAQEVLRPPGMPPGMPPQEAGLQKLAQNAVTGGNITGMQQQMAQEAMMQQMVQAQQAKAQQPVLAAEGGIASLDIDGMDDYAEGGVVGFAEGGIPVGQATTLSPEAAEWLQQREKIKAAEEALKRKEAAQLAQKIAAGRPELLRPLMQSLYESAKSGPAMVIGGVGSLLSKFAAGQMEANPELRAAYENLMLGAMDPEGSMAAAILSQPTKESPQKIEPVAAPTPASFKFAEGTPPGAIINALTGQLRNDSSLSEADRTAIAKEIQNQFVRLGAQPREEAPIAMAQSQPRMEGVASLPVSESYKVPGEELYQEALRMTRAIQGQPAPTEEELERQRKETYARRGLPDLRQAAEERIRQTAAFDAESRKQTEAANKAAMLDAWKAGILQPGAQNLADVFSGAARGMIRERQNQSATAIAQRAAERAQMILDNQIRETLDKADIAAANNDITTAREMKAKLQELQIKKQEVQIELMKNRAKDIAQYGTQMDVARLNAEQREQAAALRALVQQQGQQVRAGSKAMTYNEASDNVGKMLEGPLGMMEVMQIQADAKKAGRPVPSLSEIKEILIQRELIKANAMLAGGQPTTGGAANDPLGIRK